MCVAYAYGATIYAVTIATRIYTNQATVNLYATVLLLMHI